MSEVSAKTAPAATTDPIEARQRKLAAIREAGLDPYPYSFPRTAQAGELQDKYETLENGAETQDVVAVAGRIMAMRNNGLFIDLQDASGKIQVFCHKDSMAAAQLAKLDLMDIGDVVGAKGTVRRTPRGELSVRATEIDVLTKSMLPLPEKYHGLADVEQRYRQRYLDLIVNDEARQRLRTRARIVAGIRRFMNDMGAIEVETPMLHPIMGGASARPFITHHNALDADFYLRVAPELYLKRLLVGGFADAVYEIGRCFRNEGISPKHNPEFTSIEGYHLYKDYKDMMDLIENLVYTLVTEIHGTPTIRYGDKTIDFSTPWPRKTMAELVREATGIDFMALPDAAAAHAASKEAGLPTDPQWNWGQVLENAFNERVEHTLIQPIHVTEHPLDISPLAKTHRDNPRLTERFESFINGWEIANAFTELNDPAVQRARFDAQVEAREAGDDEAQMLDEDFITALSYGLPPCGGWGLGIDRLCMLLTDAPNIREVINFPTLKPVK